MKKTIITTLVSFYLGLVSFAAYGSEAHLCTISDAADKKALGDTMLMEVKGDFTTVTYDKDTVTFHKGRVFMGLFDFVLINKKNIVIELWIESKEGKERVFTAYCS